MKVDENTEDLDFYVANLWETNAKVWIKLHEEGYNVGRDHFYTPKFISLLPSIEGLVGIDIGCGDGYCTNELLVKKPKKIIGIDICKTLVDSAQKYELEDSDQLEFIVGNALNMPFGDDFADFAVSFFSMQDIPRYHQIVSEVYRSLKPGGFFQFSITHPCFWTHNIEWTKDRGGVVCKNYVPNAKPMFGTWTLENLPNKSTENFIAFLFRKTFSEWINQLIAAGFWLERIEELLMPAAMAKKYPSYKGHDKLPFYVIFRARKSVNDPWIDHDAKVQSG